MEIEFSGAAREVTGSCHILRVNGHTVLLDFGMFQGRRRESDEKNRHIPVPIEQIDAVVLSHAHIDHAGRLPLLARNGYANTIWCTAATRDLSAVMLAMYVPMGYYIDRFMYRRRLRQLQAARAAKKQQG